MKRPLIPTLLIAAGLLGAGSAALAERGESHRHAARSTPAQALLTPEQAATIAEARTGARVVRSRFDHTAELYRFELAGQGGTARSVSVAAAGGELRTLEPTRAQP